MPNRPNELIPEGRSADQILGNPIVDHSSWHFFQAMSWIDLAKRTQKVSALQYTALELRYGIEYLLFELLVLSSHGLSEDEYRKYIGDPHSMKKKLQSAQLRYEKLADFTHILMELSPGAPKFRYWKLDNLFRSWGIASEFLHFVGAHSRTHSDGAWFVKSLARLEGVLTPLWTASTKTLGVGLFRPDTMQPEVRSAWEEFAAGKLSGDDLRTRMRLAQPLLRARLGL